jgi:predicted DCC family thiol-disulfide oxidoreductase YuxK
VFYDGDCPLCNRTATIINHFDLLQAVAFKDLQTQADTAPQLQKYDQQVLLTDLYAVDLEGRVYAGVDTYIQVFQKMRYLAVFAWLMRIPGVYHLTKAIYRRIADNRARNVCDASCMSTVVASALPVDLYTRIFENYAGAKSKQFRFRMAKIFMVLLLLQLNSTIHYGFLYRFYDLSSVESPLANQARILSNSVLMLSTTFLGITPHALYLHDHFEGYDDLLAISYIDKEGREQWLPFINKQGRMLAPNWGRVHSMWANIAVTPNINSARLSKFIMKVTMRRNS